MNTRANYKTKLKSLADENSGQAIVNSDQKVLFDDLLQMLRLENFLCSLQSKSLYRMLSSLVCSFK